MKMHVILYKQKKNFLSNGVILIHPTTTAQPKLHICSKQKSKIIITIYNHINPNAAKPKLQSLVHWRWVGMNADSMHFWYFLFQRICHKAMLLHSRQPNELFGFYTDLQIKKKQVLWQSPIVSTIVIVLKSA